MTRPTQEVCSLNLGRFFHPVYIRDSWSMQRTLPGAMLQRGMEALLIKVYLRSRGQGRQVLPALASQKPLWFAVSSCNVV